MEHSEGKEKKIFKGSYLPNVVHVENMEEKNIREEVRNFCATWEFLISPKMATEVGKTNRRLPFQAFVKMIFFSSSLP